MAPPLADRWKLAVKLTEQKMTTDSSYLDAFAFGESASVTAPTRQHESANLSAHDLTRLLHIECPDDAWLARTTFALRRVREGESLVRAGDKFHSLYVVRSGCFKTVYTDFFGSEQVLAFPMTSDLIGADGIDCGHYGSTAISLDTSDVVILPLANLARLSYECPGLESLLYKILSRELVRMQNMAWTLGTLGAESRVAAFLLAMSARLGALGYSRSSFNLRMTRQEIGSYLGLKLETVSRALSSLNSAGIAQVHQRSIDILDVNGLREVLDPAAGIAPSVATPPQATPTQRGAGIGKRATKTRSQQRPGFALRQFAPA